MNLPRLFPRRGYPAATPARLPETRASRDDLMGGWSIVRGTDVPDFQRSGEEVRTQGWERHPVVHACVRAITDVVASVGLEVYRIKRNGEEEIQLRHPALTLLANPMPGETQRRMLQRTVAHFLLYGNAFWSLQRRTRRGLPVGIRCVAPQRVQYLWTDEQDQVIAYDWRDITGTLHERTPAEDMVHFRDIDARDGLFGYPRGASALIDIDTDSKATNYVRNMVHNHGVPGLVVLTEGMPAIDDLRAAEERYNDEMVGRGGRGKAKFMAGVSSVTPIGFDLSQLEFPDLRRVAREDICAAFGVDPRMISIGTASNDGGLSGQQYQEARFRLIQQAVLPLMHALTTEMNHWLMPEFGDVFVRFSPDQLSELTENETETSTRMIAEVNAGIRTVEEARQPIGLDELDETHHLALTSVKLTQVKVAIEEAAKAPAEVARDVMGDDAPVAGEPTPDADAGTRALRIRRAGALPVTMTGALELPAAPPVNRSITFTRDAEGRVTGANILEDIA